MFIDRKDAGKRLAKSLMHYRDRDAIVLAIPRGGVEVGYEAARRIDADFSVVITRKLPLPDSPEAGFGAVAEDGSLYLIDEYREILQESEVKRIIDEQRQECERRIKVLRKSDPLPEIGGRTVILIDDGIAMGSTMRASIQLCRNNNAGTVVVAVPVSGSDRKKKIGALVDEIIVLETPLFFRAVAQVYQNWYDVPDREVVDILERWKRRHSGI